MTPAERRRIFPRSNSRENENALDPKTRDGRACLLLVAGQHISLAAETFNPGPNRGGAIPHRLMLEDSAGKMRAFDNLKSRGGMVLFFVRSVDWRLYCQSQMIEANAWAEKFAALGHPLVALSYDPAAVQAAFVKKRHIGFTLISAPRADAIQAFHPLNTQYGEGRKARGVPYPTVYVIDGETVIQAKFQERDYQDRPALPAIYAAAQQHAHREQGDMSGAARAPKPMRESMGNGGKPPMRRRNEAAMPKRDMTREPPQKSENEDDAAHKPM